eukprot:4594360-Prymnesium_polylepis.1
MEFGNCQVVRGHVTFRHTHSGARMAACSSGTVISVSVQTPSPSAEQVALTAQLDEPLQQLADAFFAQCARHSLHWSRHEFCFWFDGHLMDYARTPRMYGMEDEDLIDLVPYPAWHWMAHAPSAVLPVPDVLAPLLEVLGGWVGSGKLAQLNKSWRDLVDEWRKLESRVELANPDAAALAVVAARCKSLQHLALRGNDCERVTDDALCALVAACPQLQSIELESCHNLTPRSVRSIADHCHSLERLTGPKSNGHAAAQATRHSDPPAPPPQGEQAVAEAAAAEKEALVALSRGCTRLSGLLLHRCVAPEEALRALFIGCCRLERLELPHCLGLNDACLAALAD